MSTKGILSIKIVSVDHYLSFPIKNLDIEWSEFRESPVKFVSVIRIFGTTSNKKKICANIHGAFPYFYIPCSETNNDKIQQLMKDLAAALDKSLNISFGRTSSTNQHIYRISLVKGM
jgi:DNA polymerase zeta